VGSVRGIRLLGGGVSQRGELRKDEPPPDTLAIVARIEESWWLCVMIILGKKLGTAHSRGYKKISSFLIFRNISG